MNFQNLLQQAKEFQTKMADMEKEIEQWRETGQAGGDGVKITLDGKGAVISVEIEPSLLTAEQKPVVEDLIKAATNQAKEKITKRIEKEKETMFSNIPLPPNFKLPF